ncbi:hypothetical protein [Sphingorhabdus sp.]|uniref:hypothetical protein n=1 Tax=Sphingorhabdus sp. TaxID=1902408 RepID=UPI00391AD175
MLLISDLDEKRKIGPEECLALAGELIRENSVEAIWENSWILRALANDRNFLINRYNERLKSYWAGDERDKYQPQSLELANNNRFYIRSNIWMPLSASSKTLEFEQKLFAYEIPHDHNFQLLTVGYYGPGYPTDIYEYDSCRVIGAVDEEIEMSKKTETVLSPGRMIFYRQSRDIHIQHTPPEMSVSLNLSLSDPSYDLIPQYVFDVNAKKIVGGAGDLHSNRLFLLDVFKAVNDGNTVEILSDFVRYFDCPRTRAVAFQVLGEIEPDACAPLLAKTDIGKIAYRSEYLARGNAAREYSRF